MKPRVFFDTNIVLDLIQGRPGFEDAARILQRQENGELTVCTSVLSMANIAYVLRKTVPANLIIPTLKQISSVMSVIPMDNGQIQHAFLLEGPDFEDIMQLSCAMANGCSSIVTHNPRDFRIKKGLVESFTPPEVFTPETFPGSFSG
jgi:predicted nucleic acid-binding protein